jgi:hypothetical protein
MLKFLNILPLVTKIVDTCFPFFVGRRTALAVVGQAVVTATRTFGVDVPLEVDQALAIAATATAAAHLGR